MAKKKVVKKVTMKPAKTCEPQSCHCKGILALIIIALTWWKPAETWANVTITILAALIFLSGSVCCCNKK